MKEINTTRLERNLKVLEGIANKINGDKNIIWILSGSTSLAIQGVDVEVNDIDILTNQYGAIKFDEVLKDYCVKKSEYSFTEKYRSLFGQYNVDDVDIDVMANFQYKLKTGEWSTINDSNKITIIDYNGMFIPTLSLEQELKEYEAMGREERVLKIKERIYNNNQKEVKTMNNENDKIRQTSTG